MTTVELIKREFIERPAAVWYGFSIETCKTGWHLQREAGSAVWLMGSSLDEVRAWIKENDFKTL